MKAGWQQKTLEEIAITFGRGKSKHRPRNEPKLYGGKYPFIQTGDIRNADHFITEYSQTYSEAGLAQSKLWPKGTICITIAANIAETGILGFDACFPDSVIGVLPNPKEAEVGFVEYLLQSFKARIQAMGKGSAQANINMGTFENERFPFPPVHEQQRIVGLLDEAFEGLATAKANAEKNLQNARGLFESHLQSVFTQRGKGWVEKPLSALCDIKHGFALKGEFFTNKGDYVVLTPGNFYESGGYRDRGEKQKYYCGEIPRDYVMEKGDMLVAMTEQAAGLLGSPLLVPERDKFLHNQRLGLVIKKPGVPWTNEFFFHVFNTKAVRKAIHDSASGVKVRHTSPTKIGEVVVSFPTSLSKQAAIVATLTDLQEETQRLAALYKRKLAALEALKKSLLHQAFTGEL